MPRKRGKCSSDGCANTTFGVLCKQCDLKRRGENKNPEYRRYWHTNKKYGVDELGFEALWNAFKGKCAICENNLRLPTKTRGQALDIVAIDHNHKNGNVRGLLCNACNKGIGLLKEDVEVLKRAINYLETCK